MTRKRNMTADEIEGDLYLKGYKEGEQNMLAMLKPHIAAMRQELKQGWVQQHVIEAMHETQRIEDE